MQDGLNWYAYCNNNPLKYIDPTGLYYTEDGIELVGPPEAPGSPGNHEPTNGNTNNTNSSSSGLLGTISTVTLGETQYTLDYLKDKTYKVVGYVKDDYIHFYPETEVLSNVKIYKGLGNVALVVAVVDKGIATYQIVTDRQLSTGQKWLKGGIEVTCTGIEYGAGIVVGLFAAPETGPGAFWIGVGATAVTSLALDKAKGWVYGQLGL